MSEKTTRSLSVEGMTCQSCVANVREALEEVPGVESAEVDLDSGRARVTADDSVPGDALRAAVEGAGEFRAREG